MIEDYEQNADSGQEVIRNTDDVSAKDALQRFIAGRPKDVDITDEEIIEEVMAVRYGQCATGGS